MPSKSPRHLVRTTPRRLSDSFVRLDIRSICTGCFDAAAALKVQAAIETELGSWKGRVMFSDPALPLPFHPPIQAVLTGSGTETSDDEVVENQK
jgi:hypothetical protein